MEISIATEQQMNALGQRLATAVAGLAGGVVIFLQGPLGAGKTTLCRALLRALGVSGTIKSPSYTLIESYEIKWHAGQRPLHHFDLYRLAEPQELDYIGGRDYFVAPAICIVEWPELGDGLLPTPDLIITIAYDGVGRRLSLIAPTEQGQRLINALSET